MDVGSRFPRRVIVLRHASAGARLPAREIDAKRPLDREGRARAKLLSELLHAHQPRVILSSPATRCLQTVEPLSTLSGVPVEERSELAIGADPDAARQLLDSCPDGTLLCTHREVIAELLGDESVLAKGEAQLLILESDGTRRSAPLATLARTHDLQPA